MSTVETSRAADFICIYMLFASALRFNSIFSYFEGFAFYIVFSVKWVFQIRAFLGSSERKNDTFCVSQPNLWVNNLSWPERRVLFWEGKSKLNDAFIENNYAERENIYLCDIEHRFENNSEVKFDNRNRK